MILTFERNKNIQHALDLGIAKQLPSWMRNTSFNHQRYWDVWLWAIYKNQRGDPKDFIFHWIVNMRGEKYFENTIIIGMDDNNELLWHSVEALCYPAVKALLEVPDLFSEEVFNMEIGTSKLNKTFMRGDSEIHYRATNFGAFVQLAMSKGNGDWEILDALKDYYKKYKKKKNV